MGAPCYRELPRKLNPMSKRRDLQNCSMCLNIFRYIQSLINAFLKGWLCIDGGCTLPCLLGTIQTDKWCITEPVHYSEAVQFCHAHSCSGPGLLALHTWCWLMLCRGLVACDMFSTEFHEQFMSFEICNTVHHNHTELVRTTTMHFRHHSSTMYTWGDMPPQCPAQVLRIYFVCNECDRTSHLMALHRHHSVIKCVSNVTMHKGRWILLSAEQSLKTPCLYIEYPDCWWSMALAGGRIFKCGNSVSDLCFA